MLPRMRKTACRSFFSAAPSNLTFDTLKFHMLFVLLFCTNSTRNFVHFTKKTACKALFLQFLSNLLTLTISHIIMREKKIFGKRVFIIVVGFVGLRFSLWQFRNKGFPKKNWFWNSSQLSNEICHFLIGEENLLIKSPIGNIGSLELNSVLRKTELNICYVNSVFTKTELSFLFTYWKLTM